MSKEEIAVEEMSTDELRQMLSSLKLVFDIVRVVDAALTHQFELDEDGKLISGEYRCYAVWEKEQRCSNCVSAKSLITKKTTSKFEFVHGDVYFVMSQYIVYQGKEYTVEMVKQIKDEVLFNAHGQDSFVDIMNQFNDKIYKDELTGAYNRRYFNEQHLKIARDAAVVLIDIDKFKTLNDTYGHAVGDLALQVLVQIIQTNIRESDRLVRMGGDEFLLVLGNIPLYILEEKLNRIKTDVSYMRFDEYPDLEVTISMGAVATPGNIRESVVLADDMLYKAKEQRNSVQIYEKLAKKD